MSTLWRVLRALKLDQLDGSPLRVLKPGVRNHPKLKLPLPVIQHLQSSSTQFARRAHLVFDSTTALARSSPCPRIATAPTDTNLSLDRNCCVHLSPPTSNTISHWQGWLIFAISVANNFGFWSSSFRPVNTVFRASVSAFCKALNVSSGKA